MTMQVEDEVEIMDDSEDELVVSRSSVKHDYSKNLHLFKKLSSEDLEDDTEEELSLLYDDDDEDQEVEFKIKKEEPEPYEADPEVSIEAFDKDAAERIMSKRGKKAKISEENELNGHASEEPEVKANEADSEDEKPLASRARRRAVKVVEDLSAKPKIPEESLEKVDKVDKALEEPGKEILPEDNPEPKSVNGTHPEDGNDLNTTEEQPTDANIGS